MENVVKFTDKFIDKVNVSEGLLSLKTSSADGALFRINAIKYLKENAITLKWLVGLVQEGSNISDANVQNFVEGIKSNVVENFNAVTIGFLHESIMENDGAIHTDVATAINNVISEGESKIGASVLGGELSKFKSYFGDLKLIESRVVSENIQNKNMVETNQLSIYSPMSYVMEHNGSEIVRVGNHIFALSESIVPTQLPNQKFFQLSEAAKNIQYNIDESRGEVSTALGKLVVENGEIKRDVDGELTVVETEKLINEFASGVELRKFDRSEITKLDNAIAVAENFENYKVLENFKVIENKNTQDVALIAEHNGAIYFGILESQRTFKRFSTVKSISEAVNLCKSIIGVDASKIFESALKAEKEMSDAKTKAIAECDSEITALEAKRTQVQEGLKTTTEGSEANQKYLDLDIQIGEALIALTKKKQAIVEGTYVKESDDKELKGIKIGDLVANKKHNTIGLVRMIDVKGDEFKTDADGWQNADDIEKYDSKKHKSFKIAPSTKKEAGKLYESTNEAQKEGDDEAYTKFFQEKLKKYKVESPEDLDEETRKKFFQEIEDEWKSDDEGSKVESEDEDEKKDDDKDVDESDDKEDDKEDEDDDKDVDESDDKEDDKEDEDDDKDVDESDDKEDDKEDEDDDKDVDEGIKMNNLDWGKTTDERNANLEKFEKLKTDAEKEEFKKNLKAANESEEDEDDEDDKDVDEAAKALNFKKGDTVKYRKAKLTAKVLSVKDGSMGKEFEIEWEDGKKGTIGQGDDVVLVEGKEPDSKFEVGDKVYFLPKLTGMDKKKPLEIERKKWHKEESIFGEKTEYMWWYSFKGSNLSAREKELTSNPKDVKESVDVAFDELTK